MPTGIFLMLLVLLAFKPTHVEAQVFPWTGWQAPTVIMPAPNGFDEYEKAIALKAKIDKEQGLPRPNATGPEEAAVDPWGEGPPELTLPERVALYTDVLEILRGAFKMECRFPPSTNYLDLFPYLYRCREFTRLFRMASAMYAQAGEYGQAARCALDGVSIARDVATQRDVISSLVSTACENLVWQALVDVLPKLSVEECRTCLQRLEELEARRVPLVEVVNWEENLARLNYQYIMADPLQAPRRLSEFIECSGYDNDNIPQAPIDLEKSWFELRPFYNRLRRQANEPFDCRQQVILPRFNPAAILVSSSWPNIIARHGSSIANFRLMQVALAARWYRLDKNHLPASIVELVPDYLPVVPRDPFCARVLQLKKVDKTIVVYSVGPDRADDNGKSIGKSMRFDSKGDISITL